LSALWAVRKNCAVVLAAFAGKWAQILRLRNSNIIYQFGAKVNGMAHFESTQNSAAYNGV